MTRRLSQHLKKVPDILATIAATSGKPLELWFQDEARIGQKNKVTRRWAERGTRPFALKDQRTASAYIFGAICPALGKAAGLVLPSCNTEAMTLHLGLRRRIPLSSPPRRRCLNSSEAMVFPSLARLGWSLRCFFDLSDTITQLPDPVRGPIIPDDRYLERQLCLSKQKG